MTERATAIDLQHLTKQFDDLTAVNDVTLTVNEGEFVTLLGSSGCGKTTTLRLIAGLEKPSNGSIHIQGREVATANYAIPPEQRRIGLVFQDYALFPHLSVHDNIAFGLQGDKKYKSKRVQELLELVGLDDYGDKMPFLLSGGQQQRIALARALAPEPDIILLDEPFSNLDTAMRQQVRAEVKKILRDAGATSIFVTHDQEEALSLSDRIAVMFAGVLHQMDTPERVYNLPTSRAVASFIGEANFVPAVAEGNVAQSSLGEVKLLNPMSGDVKLLIRPEILHLMTTDEGIPAEVMWREYYGHNQRIGLRLGDGAEVITRTDAQIVYQRGQQVRVSVYAPLLGFAE